MSLTPLQANLVARARARDARVGEITAERLEHNIAETSRLLKVPPDAFCRLGRTAPPLLYLTPTRVRKRFDDIRVLFAWTERETLQVVRRRPSILTYGAKRLYTGALKLTRDVGLPRTRLLVLIRRCPALLTLSPETLRAKIDSNSAALGLSRAEFIGKASQWPALLVYTPERLTTCLTEAAHVLDLEPDVFRRLALRHPPSLTRTPRSRASLIGPLQRLARACHHPVDIESILTTMPAALSYGAGAITAKALVRELELSEAGLRSMLSMRKAKVEALLAEYSLGQGKKGDELWWEWRWRGYLTRRDRY